MIRYMYMRSQENKVRSFVFRQKQVRFPGYTVSFCLFGFVLLTGLNSCRSPVPESSKYIPSKDTMDISEGVVTYSISYPDAADEGLNPFLPKEIQFVFQGERSSYVIRSGLGTVKIVRLLDYRKKEFISLLIDTWGTNYACRETPEEIRKKENVEHYSYQFPDSSKVIDGLTCKKAIVKTDSTDREFEIYYAPGITIHNWNSPYKELDKLLVAYPFTENGMDMILKMKKIEPREIDTDFFTIKGDFEWVSSKDFNEHLENLKK